METLNKPFLTYEQQILKLKEDKKLIISNDELAIGLLKKHSYFDLISGYKGMFKKANGEYKLHVSIEDIYALYCFDDNLRALVLRYILKVEKHIKSLMSYAFCQKFGENQIEYLTTTNYNYTETFREEINYLVGRLNQTINNPKNYTYIEHQKRKYGNVPLWVMMKALTLGTVSKMYSFMQQSIQYQVSKEFSYIDESSLGRMLDLLSRVRNVCAHNERLYDYKYRRGAINDFAVHEKLNITKRNGLYLKGKNDLFAVVICFYYLLGEEDFVSFCIDLEHEIYVLCGKTKQVQRTQLYQKMGFSLNWMEIDNKIADVICKTQSN